MKKEKNNAWVTIRPLIRPYLGRVIWLNVLTVLQAVAQVAMAVVTKYVIDAAFQESDRLLFWGLALAATLLTIVFCQVLITWLAGSTTDKCVARTRQALLAAANNCSEEQLSAYHSGALLSRGMEDVHMVCDGIVVTLPHVVGLLTRLITAFVAVNVMYPTIAPLLLLACLLIVGFTALLRPVMRRKHRQVRMADEQMMSSMQENLQQLELVQSLQMEKQSLARFAQKVKISLAARRSRRKWSVGINGALTFTSQFGTGALLLWGAVQVAKGAMSYGALTAMLQLLAMLRNPVVGLSGVWTRLSAIEVAAERLQELLDQQQPEEAPVAVDQVEAVVFENVSFHYPGDEMPVLDGFSASFPLDRWACLTGISGRGKSTIFKLILGLYTPQEGRVYLQTPQGQIPCGRATRHLFSYVPQDFSLFSGTILENFQLVKPGVQPQECKAALSVAQADFVWDLSGGMQTPVRENNTGLSKGQIQRLAIARAILMDRPIFLLDECTSALDAQTEEHLLEAMSGLQKQAILVTHRPDALKDREGITFVNMEA